MGRSGENFLNFVPVPNPQNTWDSDRETGRVTIRLVNRGFYNRLAQRFFHTPRISRVDLDEYGSFLWRQMDGERTVGQLAELMKERFGGEAEPLYDRLVRYMQILRNNRLILMRGRDRAAP